MVCSEMLVILPGEHGHWTDRGDGEEASTSGRPAHDGAVSGISSDACNRLVVTAGADGALRVRTCLTVEYVL